MEDFENDVDDFALLVANFAAVVLDDDDDQGVLENDSVWNKVTVDPGEFLHFGDAAFKLHFRMTTATFEALVHVVADYTGEAQRDRRNPDFDFRQMLLSVLWVLATPDSFRSVALLFGVTPGVLHYHYKYIIVALSELCAEYVTWPSPEERAILKRYSERRRGFPGVVGAVDGMHVSLCSAPRTEGQRYVNRHHEHSIVLQAVVDATLAFRDVYVGEPGSLHDSRIFRRSPLSKRLLEDPNMLEHDEHILGDGAYILTDKVLTPFRNNGNLTQRQRNYNFRHASCRSMVERGFGLLQGKWRRIIYLSSVNIEFAVRNVMASVMLHNFLLYEGETPERAPNQVIEHENVDVFIDDIPVDVDHVNLQAERDHPLLAAARDRGVEKRYHIVDILPIQV